MDTKSILQIIYWVTGILLFILAIIKRRAIVRFFIPKGYEQNMDMEVKIIDECRKYKNWGTDKYASGYFIGMDGNRVIVNVDVGIYPNTRYVKIKFHKKDILTPKKYLL